MNLFNFLKPYAKVYEKAPTQLGPYPRVIEDDEVAIPAEVFDDLLRDAVWLKALIEVGIKNDVLWAKSQVLMDQWDREDREAEAYGQERDGI